MPTSEVETENVKHNRDSVSTQAIEAWENLKQKPILEGEVDYLGQKFSKCSGILKGSV